MSVSSAFCCERCGHIHTSEHTVLDTFCPKCEAPREIQHLLVCDTCMMPIFKRNDRWLHCDLSQDDCARITVPYPVIGLLGELYLCGSTHVARVTEVNELGKIKIRLIGGPFDGEEYLCRSSSGVLRTVLTSGKKLPEGMLTL